MTKTEGNNFLIDKWFKGLGIFLLIFIDLSHLLTIRFDSLEKNNNNKYETALYLILLVSIVFLPVFFGKIIERISSILSKIINNWQMTERSQRLEVLLSWSFSLMLNAILIQRLLTQGTSQSLGYYLIPEMSNNTKALVSYFSDLNFGLIILVSLMSTTFFFYLCYLYHNKSVFRKFFLEFIVVAGTSIAVIIVAWSLIYINNGNWHLNSVLFPVAAINSDSPFIPLVSDDFTTWYGGYYLWFGLISRLIGNTLQSIKITLITIVTIQIVLYYLITKALFTNSLVRVLVFLNGIFWSYFYGKVIGQDLYFQYFPLRTLFPSILLVTLIYISEIKFFNKIILSIKFISITLRDILLDFIVAIAILSNFDSGISVLIMYFFMYNWIYLNSEILRSIRNKYKQIVKQFINFSLNFIIIIIILVLSFRILSGHFVDFALVTAFASKAGAGFLSLPMPDNIWVMFMLFYGFSVVYSIYNSTKSSTTKYQFGIAIWGLISIYYFVNRSHPWNLVNVSIPFFLSYGFFIEYALNTSLYLKESFDYKIELSQDKVNFEKFIQVLSPNWIALLKLSSLSVLVMPFIIISLIACVKFIPMMIKDIKTPKSYSQISALKTLSDKVATLESKMNRPSIILSDSFESYYYLHKKRKVLFYPDVVSILPADNSFESRFANVLKKSEPIVILCPLEHIFKTNLRHIFLDILNKNNYTILESMKNINISRKPQRQNKSCDIYIKKTIN